MELDIQIWLYADRERAVAEVWFDNQHLAEISDEEGTGTYLVELYQKQDGSPWCIEYKELTQALNKAKERLRNYGTITRH